MKKEIDWKKEYWKIHKLLGNETTRLKIEGLFWNEKQDKLYIQISKGKHGWLGYICLPAKMFLSSLGISAECMSWEEELEEQKERSEI